MTLESFAHQAVPGEWTRDAACAEHPTDWWFPEGPGRASWQKAQRAKTICKSCLVLQECLQFAIANDERFGIWGGTSQRERARLRSDLPDRPVVVRRDDEGKTAAQPRVGGQWARKDNIECGTRAGYLRHLRMKKKACDACKAANAFDAKEYRDKRRAAS